MSDEACSRAREALGTRKEHLQNAIEARSTARERLAAAKSTLAERKSVESSRKSAMDSALGKVRNAKNALEQAWKDSGVTGWDNKGEIRKERMTTKDEEEALAAAQSAYQEASRSYNEAKASREEQETVVANRVSSLESADNHVANMTEKKNAAAERVRELCNDW